MKQTAIYVRQSADRADSVSLETQEQLCRSVLDSQTQVIVFADRGYSGKNTQRPGLRALLTAVRQGEIEQVLVYKLDRISRNLADFTELLRVFEQYGVEFLSQTERFETASPMGKAMQSLLMVFAQLERDTICSRVRDAVFSRAKIGFDTGGPPPIGYRRIPFLLMGRHTHMLEADENAARIHACYAEYAQAEDSLSTIAEAWNTEGFLTVRGRKWSAASLGRILRNPVYARADSAVYAYLAQLGAILCTPDPLPMDHGIYLYADRRVNHAKFTSLHGTYAITAPHIGLIEPELWLACQEKLRQSRVRRTLGSGQRTWLSGNLFCAHCGSAMTVVQGRHLRYLVCSGKKRGICMGAGATWRLQETEQAMAEVLAMQLEQLSQYGAAKQRFGTKKIEQELEALRLRRIQLMQNLIQLEQAQIPVITEAIAQLDTRCKELEQRSVGRSREALMPLPLWKDLTQAEKKTIAKHLMRYAMVDGNTIHIYLH